MSAGVHRDDPRSLLQNKQNTTKLHWKDGYIQNECSMHGSVSGMRSKQHVLHSLLSESELQPCVQPYETQPACLANAALG